MSFYALWALGVLILAGALVALYKQVTILKDGWKFQKQFVRLHQHCEVRTYGGMWIFFDIALALLLFGFASFAQYLSEEFDTGADRLVFFAAGLFFAARTVQSWNKGRMIFYRQGIVLTNREIPYASIEEIEYQNRKAWLKTRKESESLYYDQAKAIEAKKEVWKKERRSKNRHSS